jgi:DNA-binding NarL/FixJ family response regulator
MEKITFIQRISQETTSLDKLKEDGYEKGYEDYQNIELDLIQTSTKLTDIQKKIINMLVAGYKKAEIRKELRLKEGEFNKNVSGAMKIYRA